MDCARAIEDMETKVLASERKSNDEASSWLRGEDSVHLPSDVMLEAHAIW